MVPSRILIDFEPLYPLSVLNSEPPYFQPPCTHKATPSVREFGKEEGVTLVAPPNSHRVYWRDSGKGRDGEVGRFQGGSRRLKPIFSPLTTTTVTRQTGQPIYRLLHISFCSKLLVRRKDSLNPFLSLSLSLFSHSLFSDLFSSFFPITPRPSILPIRKEPLFVINIQSVPKRTNRVNSK